MPTFYDPIEMNDIDIDDSAANFYIIKVDENTYTFCALTQNLDSPQMHAGDPETRVKKYWPISREQLSHANMDVLFPEDIAHNRKLRTTPFNLDELNAAFQFNPPFSPTNTQSTFGQAPQPIAQPIHHVAAPNSLASELMNQIVQRSDGTVTLQDLAGMNSQQLSNIVSPACIEALQNKQTSIEYLSSMSPSELSNIIASGDYPGHNHGLGV